MEDGWNLPAMKKTSNGALFHETWNMEHGTGLKIIKLKGPVKFSRPGLKLAIIIFLPLIGTHPSVT